MLADNADVIRQCQVHIAVQGDVVVGAIVFKITREGFYLDNVSARPLVKGIGVGRQLLEFAEAEARRQWRTSIFLATHELRTWRTKKACICGLFCCR